MGKKKDLEYIEKRMDEFFKSDHISEVDILDYVKKNKEGILVHCRSLDIGFILFASVSALPSFTAGMLFYLWKGHCLLLGENYAIYIHIMCFSFFCSAIFVVYQEEFGLRIYRPLSIYAKFLYNRENFDIFLKRISAKNLKKIDLDRIPKIDDYQDGLKVGYSSFEWLFILIFNEIIITLYNLILKNILGGNKIWNLHQYFPFILSIAFTLFVCYLFAKLIDLKYYGQDKSIKKGCISLGFIIWVTIFAKNVLSYDMVHLLLFLLFIFIFAHLDFFIKECFIYGSISGKISYIWFCPLAYSLLKLLLLRLLFGLFDSLEYPLYSKGAAFISEVFFVSIFVLVLGILVDFIVGHPHKKRQVLSLCELINSRSKNISILSNKLDSRFINLLNGYIEKNEEYKEQIINRWRSRLKSKEK